MWAPCPFHQEKTASFHVDDRKGFYYCFGCHAKGDLVSFVQETENVGFMEAVELLARDAGMQMPARDPKAAEKADRATELAKATEAAVGYFRLQLKTQAAAEARAYLERRGLTQPILDRFEIGFAPGARNATPSGARGQGASRPTMSSRPVWRRGPTTAARPMTPSATGSCSRSATRAGAASASAAAPWTPMRAPSTSTAAKPRSSTRAARSTITGPPAAPPGRGSRLSWPRATWT